MFNGSSSRLSSNGTAEARPKVLLVSNTDWYLYNFRLHLARTLSDAGFEVVMVSPHGRYHDRFAEAGFRYVPVDFDNRTSSPRENLKLVRDLRRLYQQERPSLVHHFTIKCVIFGTLASVGLDLPVVNAITGRGHIFSDQRLKTKVKRAIVTRMYRFVLGRKRSRVVFQNQADQDFFVQSGMVQPRRTRLIRGSGADLDVFRPTPEADRRSRYARPCRVLFASRLLWEKGLAELLEATRRLRDEGLTFDLHIAGEPYATNPSTLRPEDLDEIESSGHATLLGHVEDMSALLRDSDLVVLPSYHEGTPKILLEAGATGLPLIATDIPGCRGVVNHRHNGLLVPPRDADALTDAMRALICDNALRQRYGRQSREIIKAGFSASRVNGATLEIYGELLGVPSQQHPTQETNGNSTHRRHMKELLAEMNVSSTVKSNQHAVSTASSGGVSGSN